MCDLNSPFFKDEDAARVYLEGQRWPEGPICPHCACVGRIYPIEANKEKNVRKGLYHCNDCEQQFTVTVGTVFERSKVPLHKWLMATYLMSSSKKGISAKQIERSLGVTYKTAWFMCHRVREAMCEGNQGFLGGGGKVVKVDEIYTGVGKKKMRRLGIKTGHIHVKEKVFSLVERQGRVRSFHVQAVNSKTLRPIMQEQIAKDSHVMSDEHSVYVKIDKFQSIDSSNLLGIVDKHDHVNHRIHE